MFLMLIGTGVVISVLLDVLDDFVVLRDLKNKQVYVMFENVVGEQNMLMIFRFYVQYLEFQGFEINIFKCF